MRLGYVPDDFVRRFLDIYSPVADGQPSSEIAKGDEDAVRVLMRLSSVTRAVLISEHPYAVVFEKTLYSCGSVTVGSGSIYELTPFHEEDSELGL